MDHGAGAARDSRRRVRDVGAVSRTMITSTPYLDFVNELEAMMREARRLGLYRTTESVHAALNIARSEMFEVLPTDTPSPPAGRVDFHVGPIREQRSR